MRVYRHAALRRKNDHRTNTICRDIVRTDIIADGKDLRDFLSNQCTRQCTQTLTTFHQAKTLLFNIVCGIRCSSRLDTKKAGSLVVLPPF